MASTRSRGPLEMEVERPPQVLKGVERTWEVGGCGRRGATGAGDGFGKTCPLVQDASRSFLFFLPTHIYALLALQLPLQPLPLRHILSPPRFSFLSSPSPGTDGTSPWQPEVEEAAADRYLTLFGSPFRITREKKAKTEESAFRWEEKTTIAGRGTTRRPKLRAITITRRDGLKLRTGTVKPLRVFTGLALIRRDVHRARPSRRRNAFLSAAWHGVFLLRESPFPPT